MNLGKPFLPAIRYGDVCSGWSGPRQNISVLENDEPFLADFRNGVQSQLLPFVLS